MIKPLTGMLVVDFSQVLAAPLCAQALGDLGAEVIKVEPLGKGDDSRSWPPHRSGVGATFLSANRNKQSIALDLKTKQGREIARKLARLADVVVENYTTGVVERLGIDYESLRKENERLVYCSVSGYGRSGPLAFQKGYDIVLQAFSGMMGITGDEAGPPTRIPYSPIDQATGQNAIAGILAALLERARTGKGSFVEVSLFDSALSLLKGVYQNYWETGRQPRRERIRQPTIAPYQAFNAADGVILIGIANEKLWQAFCTRVGREELIKDPRFLHNRDRVANYDNTVGVVQAIVGTRTLDAWEVLLSEIGIPHSRVSTFEEILSHPHTAARGAIVETQHPELGTLKTITLPIRFNGERADGGMPPPQLGEHTREVLTRLGLSESAMRDLETQGVVEVAPRNAHAPSPDYLAS